MRRGTVLFWVMVVALALAGSVFAVQDNAKQEKEGERRDILYVCNCGPECKCNTVSKNPGKCSCGQDLVATHDLKIDGSEAVLCTCGKDCMCKLDPKDPTKCGCGNKVKRVSLKGFYVCGCGSGCDCNTVSDKPGKCRCGNELKKI